MTDEEEDHHLILKPSLRTRCMDVHMLVLVDAGGPDSFRMLR